MWKRFWRVLFFEERCQKYSTKKHFSDVTISLVCYGVLFAFSITRFSHWTYKCLLHTAQLQKLDKFDSVLFLYRAIIVLDCLA